MGGGNFQVEFILGLRFEDGDLSRSFWKFSRVKDFLTFVYKPVPILKKRCINMYITRLRYWVSYVKLAFSKPCDLSPLAHFRTEFSNAQGPLRVRISRTDLSWPTEMEKEAQVARLSQFPLLIKHPWCLPAESTMVMKCFRELGGWFGWCPGSLGRCSPPPPPPLWPYQFRMGAKWSLVSIKLNPKTSSQHLGKILDSFVGAFGSTETNKEQ